MELSKKRLALLVSVVAISAGLVGYYVASSPDLGLTHIFGASSTTTSSMPSQNGAIGNNNPMHWGGGNPSPQGSNWRGNNGGGTWFPGGQQVASIAAGTSVKISSTAGEFRVIGDPTDNGTASGTVSFTVNSELSRSYVLTISGGSFTINGVTYTISSGSAQMNLFANGIQGQGTTSSGGSFAIYAFASGNFSGTTSARAMVDIKVGGTEYGVLLTGGISG